MATSRCYECAEELDVTTQGARHQEGSQYRNPATGLDRAHHVATILPNASRTWPPALGDYPEWTEEEIRAEAKRRTPIGGSVDADALVKAYNEGKDYNESMLTKAERTDRLQLKDDTDKLSYLQSQIKTARAERAQRLAAAEAELAQINAANEAERKTVADETAAGIISDAHSKADPATLDAFKKFQADEAAKKAAAAGETSNA